MRVTVYRGDASPIPLSFGHIGRVEYADEDFRTTAEATERVLMVNPSQFTVIVLEPDPAPGPKTAEQEG